MGNDANPGTSIAGAWATVNKVNNSKFLPGDTLYFEGGHTFNGNISIDGSDANDPNNIFVIASYGTGRAIINAGTGYGFYAYNTQGFSISNLIFDGNTASTNTGTGILIFSDLTGNIKFKSISVSYTEIKNFGAEGIKIYTTDNLTGFQNVSLNNLSVHNIARNGIIIYGYVAPSLVGWQHKNVTISNCEIYQIPGSLSPAGLEGSGIVMSGVDGGVIQHCVAHDNGQNNISCGGPGGIWSFESNNITIQYCESYNNHSGTGCDGLGFDLDGGVTNSVMQYNYSHNNDGAGYLMGQYPNARPWSNNTMRYNISENDGVLNEGGIGLFKGPGTTMSGANIYNNTIYVSPKAGNSNVSAVYFQNWNTGINQVAFYNNIFITSGAVSLINIPVGYSAFFAGNIYWSSGSPFNIHYQGNNYLSLNSWRTASGNETVGGINTGFNSDPQLTNVGAGGTIGFGKSLQTLNAYKVNSITSPSYHTALDLKTLYSINTGNRDFWGTMLSGGTSNDIGANQFNATQLTVLLGFYGNCSGSLNNIFWATGEEVNLNSIELMYSIDGLHFTRLERIQPKGNNSNYNFVNDSASPGNNYYKLIMIDSEGLIYYSSVLNITCNKDSGKINVWPNPFSQSINISMKSEINGPVSITLYDAVGKLLLKRDAQLLVGDNLLTFYGMDYLPSGSYYLQVLDKDLVEHFKLIKSGR